MSERPTPITDAVLNTFDGNQAKLAADLATHAEILERQLADALAQLRIADEQLALERGALAEARRERDNAISDWRQADGDTVRALHERNEAREQRDALAELAGQLIAMIRVNVILDKFRETTIEQVDAHLDPWIKRIHAVKKATQEP